MPRPYVAGAADPLPAPVVMEFLTIHVPYRVWMLEAAVSRVPAKTNEDSAYFEAGTVSGRLLLDFLGIGMDKGKLANRRDYKVKGGKTDDVKVVDLGGRWVDVLAIDPYESETLEAFHIGASKACAHFTWDSDHELDHETYKEAAPIIRRLAIHHLPGLKLPPVP